VAPESVAEQLRWGAGWLEALPWARRSKDSASDVAQAASCLTFSPRLGRSRGCRGWHRVANELATHLLRSRVVGLIKRNGGSPARCPIPRLSSAKAVWSMRRARWRAIEQRCGVAYPPLPATDAP
jgi:hypothetical protein